MLSRLMQLDPLAPFAGSLFTVVSFYSVPLQVREILRHRRAQDQSIPVSSVGDSAILESPIHGLCKTKKKQEVEV